MWEVVSLVLFLLLMALFLTALFLVVRAAVEGGVRRAVREDVLQPSVRELIARRSSTQ